MLMPGTASAAIPRRRASAAAPGRAAAPFPVAQIGAALGVFDGVLTQLYQSYLPLFAQGKVTAEPFEGHGPRPRRKRSTRYSLAAAANAGPGCPRPTPGRRSRRRALPGAAQLQLGIERTFGGLGEAFGLGPARQLQEAWREMLVASVAKQRAQAEIPRAGRAGVRDRHRDADARAAGDGAARRARRFAARLHRACGPKRSTRRCTTRCSTAPASTATARSSAPRPHIVSRCESWSASPARRCTCRPATTWRGVPRDPGAQARLRRLKRAPARGGAEEARGAQGARRMSATGTRSRKRGRARRAPRSAPAAAQRLPRPHRQPRSPPAALPLAITPDAMLKELAGLRKSSPRARSDSASSPRTIWRSRRRPPTRSYREDMVAHVPLPAHRREEQGHRGADRLLPLVGRYQMIDLRDRSLVRAQAARRGHRRSTTSTGATRRRRSAG